MRVVHITYQHSADDARILHKQCRSLAEAGLDTHLLAPPPKPPKLFGVTLHSLNTDITGNKLRRLRKWFTQIKVIVADVCPDIIHLHDPLLLRLARHFCAETRARLVYDAHEDHARQIRALSHLSWARRTTQAALYGHLERNAPKWIDLFVAATPGIADHYPADRTITVRNLPRLSDFEPTHAQARNASMIYVGGLTRSRGIIEMIDAIELVQHDDARLILAGKFDSDETRRAAESRPGWKHVDFRGWVDHAHVPTLLDNAAAGLVVLHPKPNYLDAWPVKLFEYMASGLPFIASSFQPWRDMLSNEKSGIFVDPLDVRAIAAAMEQLLHHPNDSAAMGAVGRARIERDLHWQREAAILLRGYETLGVRT